MRIILGKELKLRGFNGNKIKDRRLDKRKGVKLATDKGQYLTVDSQVIKDLIKTAQINKDDKIIEVGAGTGILTEALCQRAGLVYAYEIDKQFEPFLKRLADKYQNLV